MEHLGCKAGVAKLILDEEPLAIYTHCYGHSLNLACNDTIKQCVIVRNAFDTANEITKLIKKSPRRDAILNRLKLDVTSVLERFAQQGGPQMPSA